MTIPKIAAIKNAWLEQQVEVAYPTKESLAGLALYQQKLAACHYQTLEVIPNPSNTLNDEEIFVVDFHRLTVMFALLQAQQWPQSQQQNLIVEFLSQIIYSKPCSLYLAFKAGEAIAGAIVTTDDNCALISDIAIKKEHEAVKRDDFIAALCAKAGISDLSQQELMVEHCSFPFN